MSFFDELKTSLEEAVEIKQGLKKPARVTRHEIEDAKAVVDRKRCSRRIRHSLLNSLCSSYRVLSGLQFYNVLNLRVLWAG